MKKIAYLFSLTGVAASSADAPLTHLAWTANFYPNGFPDGAAGIALLLLRVGFGILCVIHGYPKLLHLKQWAKSIHMPVFLCFIAACTIFFGGLFLIAGLLTPLVSLGLLGTMAFAFVQELLQGHPFVAQDPYLIPEGDYTGPNGKGEPPSLEKAFIYCIVMITLMLAGPGQFSLDAALLS